MPIHGFPERLQEKTNKNPIHQPIATEKGFLNKGYLTQSWDPAILAQYGGEMYSDLN